MQSQIPVPGDRRLHIYVAAWVLALAAVAVSWPKVFPLDDAYITLHNAQVLLSGQGDPVFGSSYLVGATSAVHLALVAALGLILPLPYSAFAICLASLVLYVSGLERLARKQGLTGARVFIVAALGVLWGSNIILLLNGLETGLAMAAVVWMLILCDDRRWLPIVCGIAPFIRPELALLAAPLCVRAAWKHRTAAPLVHAAIAACPWMLWYWQETGNPFPGTGAAKIYFFAEYREALLWKIDVALKGLFIIFIAPLITGFLGYKRLPAGWCAALFVVGWVSLATLTLPGSLHWNDGRYCATLIPALLYGVIGLATERSRASDMILGSLSLVAVYTGVTSAKGYAEELKDTDLRHDAANAVASLPAQSVVLIHDAGWPAWINPKARLVDIVGLKSPASEAWHRALTKEKCGWGPALSAIARESRATHLLVLQDRGFWGCVQTNLEAAGWNLHPVHRGRYDLFEIKRPLGRATATARTPCTGPCRSASDASPRS